MFFSFLGGGGGGEGMMLNMKGGVTAQGHPSDSNEQ